MNLNSENQNRYMFLSWIKRNSTILDKIRWTLEESANTFYNDSYPRQEQKRYELHYNKDCKGVTNSVYTQRSWFGFLDRNSEETLYTACECCEKIFEEQSLNRHAIFELYMYSKVLSQASAKPYYATRKANKALKPMRLVSAVKMSRATLQKVLAETPEELATSVLKTNEKILRKHNSNSVVEQNHLWAHQLGVALQVFVKENSKLEEQGLQPKLQKLFSWFFNNSWVLSKSFGENRTWLQLRDKTHEMQGLSYRATKAKGRSWRAEFSTRLEESYTTLLEKQEQKLCIIAGEGLPSFQKAVPSEDVVALYLGSNLVTSSKDGKTGFYRVETAFWVALETALKQAHELKKPTLKAELVSSSDQTDENLDTALKLWESGQRSGDTIGFTVALDLAKRL